MRSFSDRQGITSPHALARDDMSPELATALWNVFQPILFERTAHPGPKGRSYFDWDFALDDVYRHLSWRVNELSIRPYDETAKLEAWFFYKDQDWYRIYNLIEYLVTAVFASNMTLQNKVINQFNVVFEREGSRWRFARNGELTEITDPVETAEVDARSAPAIDLRGHASTSVPR